MSVALAIGNKIRLAPASNATCKHSAKFSTRLTSRTGEGNRESLPYSFVTRTCRIAARPPRTSFTARAIAAGTSSGSVTFSP